VIFVNTSAFIGIDPGKLPGRGLLAHLFLRASTSEWPRPKVASQLENGGCFADSSNLSLPYLQA